jgi:hypothetical protein
VAADEGVPSNINGSSASQNALMVQPPIKTILTDTVGNSTLVDYCWKQGRVIASGLTLEYAWDHGWDAKPLLENMLAASTSAPGCQHTAEGGRRVGIGLLREPFLGADLDHQVWISRRLLAMDISMPRARPRVTMAVPP